MTSSSPNEIRGEREGGVWFRLVRNASSSMAATFVSLLTGFLVMPYVVHHIGATAFGVWMLVNSLVGYMGLLDVGLAPTLVKRTAALVDRKDEPGVRELNRVVSTIFWVYALIGIVAFIVAAAATIVVPRYFHIPPASLSDFRAIMWVAAAQAALAFPMGIWNGLTGGLQDYHVLNSLGIVTNVVRASLTIFLLYSGFGVVSLVVMGFVVSLCIWTFLGTRVFRRLPQLRIQLSRVSHGSVTELAPASGVMLIWSLAGYSVHQLDRVLIAAMMPVASLTTYEVGNRLSENSRAIIQSWLSTILPSASALHAASEEASLRTLYLRGTKYLMGTYGAAGVCLMVFGRRFIELWMGHQYAESSVILLILVAGNLIQSVNVVAHVMFVGIGELRAFSRIMTAYPLLVVFWALVLVRRYGLIGMALALALAILTAESFFLPTILRRFAIQSAELLHQSIFPVLRAALPAAIVGMLISGSSLPQSWTVVILGILATLVTYLALFARFGATPAERAELRNFAGSYFPFLFSRPAKVD